MKKKNNTEYTFDYTSIPLGFYDEVAKKKKGMRSFWHHLKFQRIKDYIETTKATSIIDYGCFCGTFLGSTDNSQLKEQYGLDILQDQIDYAQKVYATDYRKFMLIDEFKRDYPHKNVDVITIIEVIEHLEISQIQEILQFATERIKPGGKFILTTPNYASMWPLLEFVLNKVSDVNYEEQHITRFRYGNIEKRLRGMDQAFSDNFTTEFVTSSHFFTPYVAQLSFSLADKMSKFSPHQKWRFPLGNLLMICFSKKPG